MRYLVRHTVDEWAVVEAESEQAAVEVAIDLGLWSQSGEAYEAEPEEVKHDGA